MSTLSPFAVAQRMREAAPSLFCCRGVLDARSSPTLASITPAKRDELLAKARAGSFVELEMTVLAYEQRRGARNKNSVRFAESALTALGASGKGTPFIRDHRQGDTLARSGTVTASATTIARDDTAEIRQTVTLRDPSAVERALRGLLGPVSIGWHPTGPIECSVCSSPILTKCYHWPGERLREAVVDGEKRYERDARGSVVVEWVFTAAELVETSEVNVAAVPLARIEEIRASVASAFAVALPSGFADVGVLAAVAPRSCSAPIPEPLVVARRATSLAHGIGDAAMWRRLGTRR